MKNGLNSTSSIEDVTIYESDFSTESMEVDGGTATQEDMDEE